jgi:1,4-alpha-glucan branching enzyme
MPASLAHITDHTRMGANLTADGATFRYWAPNAAALYVLGDFNQWIEQDACLLQRGPADHWVGFLSGIKDRQRYKLRVHGPDGPGWKRDPFARELTTPWPGDCVVRSTGFPWHQTGFVTPRFHEFVIYQLHVGAFYAPNRQASPDGAGTFLDVAEKVPYLADLGVTVLQLMPIQEFDGTFGLGYAGTDYYSPEMAFGVSDAELPEHLTRVNQLLSSKGQAPFAIDEIRGEMNQLKALIDLCHVYGLAVILDVVYNHAGGNLDEESIYFFDRQSGRSEGRRQNSLFFLDRGHAGGLVFDYGKDGVRDFLIQNAKFFVNEYRVDGFRYDQVSVIDHDGAPYGWRFCQDLTSTLKLVRPEAMNLAEYWNVNPLVVEPPGMGAGFDSTLTDGLRIALRRAIREASYPGDHPIDMSGLLNSLWPAGFSRSWQFVQGPENHDRVFRSPFADDQREERIARLADPSNPRSWFARSRARVAMGITLTAPGNPMMFMGQEFLEDKQWSDDVHGHPELLIYWDGLGASDPSMRDFLRCTRELVRLRRHHPGLQGDGFRGVSADDRNRVLSFHRWVEGVGDDVIVVASLANANHYGYRIGFPGAGIWREVMNTDVYDHWVNPNVAGNGGLIIAEPVGWQGFQYSAALTVPANGVLVFAR